MSKTSRVSVPVKLTYMYTVCTTVIVLPKIISLHASYGEFASYYEEMHTCLANYATESSSVGTTLGGAHRHSDANSSDTESSVVSVCFLRWSWWRLAIWPSLSSTLKNTGPNTFTTCPDSQGEPWWKLRVNTSLFTSKERLWAWLSSLPFGDTVASQPFLTH